MSVLGFDNFPDVFRFVVVVFAGNGASDQARAIAGEEMERLGVDGLTWVGCGVRRLHGVLSEANSEDVLARSLQSLRKSTSSGMRLAGVREIFCDWRVCMTIVTRFQVVWLQNQWKGGGSNDVAACFCFVLLVYEIWWYGVSDISIYPIKCAGVWVRQIVWSLWYMYAYLLL